MPRAAWLRAVAALAVVLMLGGESLGLPVAGTSGSLEVTVQPVPGTGGYRLVVVLTNQGDHPVAVQLERRQFRVVVYSADGTVWQHDGMDDETFWWLTLEPGQARRFTCFWPEAPATDPAEVVATVFVVVGRQRKALSSKPVAL
ncbi:MAG: hypothetical protein AB1445_02055 [Bacillota bacterium]